MAGIAKELWLSLIKEGMIPGDHFLARSVDMSEGVEHNKINLAEAGIEPEVLLDNTTYPIGVEERADIPLELPLHTFDTKNTVVRNVEAKEAAYDKMESVVRGHRNSLRKKIAAYAAHNWAPNANRDYTPVLVTSGDVHNGVKRMTFDDILDMEAKFRDLDVDMDSVVAVLTPQHLTDLRAQDTKLYKDILKDKKVFSFALFSYSGTASYDTTSMQKKAFGAAFNPAQHSKSSLFYCDTEVMRAFGDVDMFARYKDPQERGDIIGFQRRATALPIRGKYIGSIYGGK